MRRQKIAGVLWVATWIALGVIGVAQEPPHPMDLPEDSPVKVETLELEPTVIKTGDELRQTYRVRFPDLVSEGKELIILEDRMVPENLPVHPFEGVSLEIEKRLVEGEHIWDFVYGFRLIDPDKATYILPGFSFFYLVRDLGEDVEDAEVQQVDAGEAIVRYVTTITELPVLDIRDTIELGSFATRARVFRTLAWAVAPVPLLVWLVLLVRLARRPKTVSIEQQKEAAELELLESQIPVPPSIWEARRSLRRQLRALEGLPVSDNGGALRDIERGLVISAREYLQAELPELNTGDTPKDIQRHVKGLKQGARKEALQALASRLVVYQSGLERGATSTIEDPMAEAQALGESLTLLRPHVRLWLSPQGARRTLADACRPTGRSLSPSSTRASGSSWRRSSPRCATATSVSRSGSPC